MTGPIARGQARVRDDTYLLQAIALAAQSRAAGDPPFGSVLVHAAGAVLRGERNTVTTDQDITAHPELKLSKWAARNFDEHMRRSLTLFTSCQPCPTCVNVIARARIGRVVYALSTEQLRELKPLGYVDPDAATVRYSGPALHAEAIVPVLDYYS